MEWNGTENNPFFQLLFVFQLLDELLVASLLSSAMSQSSSPVNRSLSLSASDGNDTRKIGKT